MNNNNIEDRYPADSELKFSGTVLASVTHELNNVFSILNQTGGLLEDLLSISGEKDQIPPEKLRDIAEKIRKHTDRGIKIIKHLNKFAHSSDLIYGPFILNDLVENLSALLGRFVSLKSATISTMIIPDQIEIINFPFKVQQVIFIAFKIILSITQKGNEIILSLEKSESGSIVNVKLVSENEVVLPDLAELEKYTNEIGADLFSGKELNYTFIGINIPPYVSNKFA